MAKNQIKMSIPSLSEYIGVVRLALSGIGSRMNFSVEEIEDIKIAISEACTNSVQHGYNGSKTGMVDITCTMDSKKLEILVEDSGKGFDVKVLNPKNKKERSGKESLGLGITFIKNLMDETEVKSTPGKGTKVRMVKLKSS